MKMKLFVALLMCCLIGCGTEKKVEIYQDADETYQDAVETEEFELVPGNYYTMVIYISSYQIKLNKAYDTGQMMYQILGYDGLGKPRLGKKNTIFCDSKFRKNPGFETLIYPDEGPEYEFPPNIVPLEDLPAEPYQEYEKFFPTKPKNEKPI